VNPTREDVDTIMDIMKHFGKATGLCMNMAKSTVLPIRCSQININEVLLNFTSERSSFPFTYLGLPVTIGQLKLVHLQPCMDWAIGKLVRLQGKLLNQGGCRELVKSVLRFLPTYLLTVLKLPKKFYKDLDKLRRRLLWASDQQIHGGKCKVN
jgi:hypothetical protein